MISSPEGQPRWRKRMAQQVLLAPRATLELILPQVPERGPLRWFWFDGLAASIQDAMTLSFIPLLALALGGTAVEIGWLTALGALVGTAALLPGARLAEWSGRPKALVLVAGLVARTAILLIALWPLAGARSVWIVILLATVRTMSFQLGVPAWTAITADIVPAAVRGRYFSSRNVAIALGAAVALPLAGQIIAFVGGVRGYQVVIGAAGLVGLIASYCYARIPVPPGGKPVEVRGKNLPLLRRLRARPNFVQFCVHSMLWNFALQVAAPFFNVYLVQSLGAGTLLVGLLATVSTVASLPGQRLWGAFADRAGARRAMVICGLLIPLIPIGWLFVTDPRQVVFLNLAAGFLWAGYNVAAFNFLLDSTPDLRRPRYVALYSTLVGLANAGGPLVGGWLAQHIAYQAAFVASGIGRFAAIGWLIAFVREPRDVVEGVADESGLE
jgi:MFS family permease